MRPASDKAVEAAIEAMPGDFEILAEDDNHYCNPPRTRLLRGDEEREGVREMVQAAFPHVIEDVAAALRACYWQEAADFIEQWARGES